MMDDTLNLESIKNLGRVTVVYEFEMGLSGKKINKSATN